MNPKDRVATLSDFINLNAGAVGRHLQLSFPTGLLLNRDHCQMIERRIHDLSADGAWEVLQASTHSLSNIPKTRGVYMFVWRPTLRFVRSDPHGDHQLMVVLYVGGAGGHGKTGTLHSRFKGEYQYYIGAEPGAIWSSNSLDTRRARMRCYLSLEPLEYWFLTCGTAENVNEIESRLQSLLTPPLNVRIERILRTGAPRAAF